MWFDYEFQGHTPKIWLNKRKRHNIINTQKLWRRDYNFNVNKDHLPLDLLDHGSTSMTGESSGYRWCTEVGRLHAWPGWRLLERLQPAKIDHQFWWWSYQIWLLKSTISMVPRGISGIWGGSQFIQKSRSSWVSSTMMQRKTTRQNGNTYRYSASDCFV